MNDNNQQSIFKYLKKTINFHNDKKKYWKVLKKNCRIQIQKNFLISDTANAYLKNWIS